MEGVARTPKSGLDQSVYGLQQDRVSGGCCCCMDAGLSCGIADSDNPIFIGGLRADTIVDCECRGVF
jgi:hypothetical protein